MKSRCAILVMTAAWVAGCGGNKDEGQAGPPAMPVNAILAKAVKEPVRESVGIVGSLAARDEVTIISELYSTVSTVAVKEGQHVEKGDTLFELDDVRTKAMVADAEAAHRLAELTHNRNRSLLENNTISQQAFDEAEADLKSKEARLDMAGDDHSKATITAPFAGMIGERSVSAGQFVARGRQLISMVRTDPLDIKGDVPERYLAGLSNGLGVEFKTEAYPDRVFKAAIAYVSPVVDPVSRTVRVKADVPNAEGLLKPGMFGNMSIVLGERADSLLIPEACIQMQGSNKTVMTVNREGLSEFAPVQTGKRSRGMVEVTSGLNEGDLVVVEGWQKMGPGTPVVAAPGSEKHGVQPAVPMEAGR